MSRKFRETIRNCEAMAIDERADLLDLLFAEPIVPNEEKEGAVVVTIHGPLEHHACGYGDSYEQIRLRFGEALESEAECIILRIDSPGGVVSGLNQAVYDMTRAKKNMGKHVIVYVDELCASAAYALACVGDEIIIPPSGIAGSVGVISTMCDQVKADEKAGLNFVTITSGARKDDGHPHTAISDEAVAVEQRRVDRLAKQFFAIVKKARGIDPAPLQAGIFLGAEAVAKGIADEVMGWEELLVDIREVYGSGNAVAQPGTAPDGDADMLKQKALIKRLAAESDPKKRTALAAQLSTLMAGTKKTYKKMEEEETEETDDEEEEEGNDTDREEESEEDDMPGDEPDKDDKKESKKAKKSAKAKAPFEEEESSEEEEEKAEAEDEEEKAESEEEEEEALLSAVLGNTKGRRAERARGALAALIADAKRGRRADAQVRKLSAKAERDALFAMVDERLAKRHITRSEAKWLKTQPKATVDSFLKTRKSPIVLTDEDAQTPPAAGSGIDPTQIGASEIGPKQMAVLEAASRGSGVPLETLIKQYKPTLPNGIKLGGN